MTSQPLIVALSAPFRIFYDRKSVFDADSVTEIADSLCASPEISEFPVTVQVDGIPDNVIMNMGFVDMSADDKGMTTLGEPTSKFHPHPVGLFGSHFPGGKGLTDMVGNHIILFPATPSDSYVLPLCQQKFRISNTAVAFITCDEFTVVSFLQVSNIGNNVADCTAFSTAFSNM